MNRENPKTYTAEFRASAVKLANESDKPIAQVAKDLGINVNTGNGGVSVAAGKAGYERRRLPRQSYLESLQINIWTGNSVK